MGVFMAESPVLKTPSSFLELIWRRVTLLPSCALLCSPETNTISAKRFLLLS